VNIARALVDTVEHYGEVVGNDLHLLEGNVFDAPRRSGRVVPLASATLLSPTQPRRILAILGGFVDLGGSPWTCGKMVSPVSGDHGVIEHPDFITDLAMEAEMAVVVGRTIHRGTREEAQDSIFGYTCFNDVTAPELMDERSVRPFPDVFGAKSMDTFASMGPWVRTDLDDDAIAAGLEILCRVNGATVQQGNTKEYIHSPSAVVAHVSRSMPLHPGDVIALGTPYPYPLVAIGDVVEVEVEGIGVLTNHIARRAG
jgi:2-keto-4-pentenoate hydratase/2-oxohepta-3-ene-1,7-dioic acid hydratase in catechol pathway